MGGERVCVYMLKILDIYGRLRKGVRGCHTLADSKMQFRQPMQTATHSHPHPPPTSVTASISNHLLLGHLCSGWASGRWWEKAAVEIERNTSSAFAVLSLTKLLWRDRMRKNSAAHLTCHSRCCLGSCCGQAFPECTFIVVSHILFILFYFLKLHLEFPFFPSFFIITI